MGLASVIGPAPPEAEELPIALLPQGAELAIALLARASATGLAREEQIALAIVMSRAATRAVETGMPSEVALRDTTDPAHAPAATAALRARNLEAVVPAAVAVAADVADKRRGLRDGDHRSKDMKSASSNGTLPKLFWIARVATLAWLSAIGFFAARQSATKTTPAASAQAAPAQDIKTFDTPQQAADALVDAAEKFDVAALAKIFGPDGDDIVLTGEYAQDRKRATDFAAQALEKKSVSVDQKTGSRAFLLVGNEDWPFPVPIVKRGAKWSFDASAGRQELYYRRIGSNELHAIEICRGYVEAQYEYAFQKREGYDVNQYAQRIISTPGKQDGLAWQNADGNWGGPIGEGIARAIEQGYSTSGEPYNGYFFKVLKGQGPDAPLGELDYVVKGVMIGGFALVAAPAEYGLTGLKTLIVSQDGVVYQKDFGPTTLDEFKKMERFNPDKSWTPVPEE